MNFSDATFKDLKVTSATPDWVMITVDADLTYTRSGEEQTPSALQATLDILYKGNKIGEVTLDEAKWGKPSRTPRPLVWKMDPVGCQSAIDLLNAHFTTESKEEITFQLSATSLYTPPIISFGKCYLQGKNHKVIKKIRVYLGSAMKSMAHSAKADLDFINPFDYACEFTDMVIEVRKGATFIGATTHKEPMRFSRGSYIQQSPKKAVTIDLKASLAQLVRVFGAKPRADVYVKSATLKFGPYTLKGLSMDFLGVELEMKLLN